MKAKDENLFSKEYITCSMQQVELRMVSAEAAAVIGETRILSADQVKVRF